MARKVTVETTVYSYEELLEANEVDENEVSDSAIENVKEWLGEYQTGDHYWSENVIHTWKEALEQIGFYNIEIAFSGFWSQGDGASFTAEIDFEKMVDFLATPIEEKMCVTDGDCRPWLVAHLGGKPTNPRYLLLKRLYSEFITCPAVKRTSHHYSHEKTCSVEDGDLNDRGDYIPHPVSKWNSRQPKTRALFNSFMEDLEQLRLNLSQAIYAALEEEYEYLRSDEAIAQLADSNGYEFTADGEHYE